MPIEILMPALSPTMTEGNLAKWNKKEGDKIAPGEVICEIETDKATMEVEAVDEGVLGKILVNEGSQNVAVNAVIALLLTEGEDKKALASYQPSAVSGQKKEEHRGQNTEDSRKENRSPLEGEQMSGALQNANANRGGMTAGSTEKTPHASSASASLRRDSAAPPQGGSGGTFDRVKASPLAKRVARELGIDISMVMGSGPHGRVVRNDVESFKRSGGGGARSGMFGGGAAVGRSPVESTAIPNSLMRKTIAKRLLEAKTTIPHFYLTIDCELDRLLEVRQQLNDLAAQEAGKDKPPAYKLTVNDFIVKASALALRKVPLANASWTDEAIVQYTNVDVAVAVAIDGGLITPIVKNADQKTLAQISAEVKDLAARAKGMKLKPEEYQGGGFSISNLGMFGIKEFSAIINPPQSCILAVGAGEQRFVPDKNGAPKLANAMTVTLSCDHRVVDGALGATLLKWFKQFIEQPVTMFI